MGCETAFRFARLILVCAVLSGCGGGGGLDGFRGTVISIDDNQTRYIVRDAKGSERHIWTDKNTRRDPVTPGDEVRVFASKDGRAAYIQKLN